MTDRCLYFYSAYLNRLKRQVCETFENPPLVTAVADRFLTADTGRSRDAVVAAAVRDDPHDDQNLAANFLPLVLRAATPPPPPSSVSCCSSRTPPP